MFRARDTKHNRDVSLKVFLPTAVPKGSFSELFRPVRELQHPNLVTLYEAGKTGLYNWIAMDYVEGDSLDKQLERAGLAGMLDWQHVLRYGIHLASALDVLHQHQVVHRAVTPRSILIARSDKQAKLGSLWQARAARDCHAESDLQDVLRNVGFMPPERLRGGQPGTLAGDIYSLGAVLYTLLAGRPPFEGETQAETIAKVVQTEPVAPKEFQLSLPDAFQHAVLRMLAKRPEDRYAHAGELLTDLQHVTDRQSPVKTLPPRTPATPPPAPRRARRHRHHQYRHQCPRRSPVPQGAACAVRSAADGKLVSVACTCGSGVSRHASSSQGRRCAVRVVAASSCCPAAPRSASRRAPPHGGQPHPVPQPQQHPLMPPGQVAPAAPPKTAGLLGHELIRYIIIVVLLILTLVVSFAGLFLDSSPRQPGDGAAGVMAEPAEAPLARASSAWSATSRYWGGRGVERRPARPGRPGIPQDAAVLREGHAREYRLPIVAQHLVQKSGGPHRPA